MLKSEKNKIYTKSSKKKYISKIVFVLGLLIIILAGVVATLYFKKENEYSSREELARLSDVATAAVNPRRLITLKANNEDLGNPDYQRLKEQMVLINNSLKIFGTEWIYLIKNENSKWIFSVDPLDENSPDYTSPGTVYENYPKELDSVLEKRKTVVVGPYSDQWGEFISAFSPIKDLESGEILGVLGVDIDTRIWKTNVLRAQIFPVTISFFVLTLWILFFIYQERKNKLEKEIRSREERFKSITESTKDLIYRSDLSGKITYASPAVEKMLKFSQTEVIGMNFIDFVSPSEHVKAMDAFRRLANGESVNSFEIQINAKNGKKIWVDLNFSPVHSDGEVLEIQGMVRDITQRKNSEEEIKKQNEELKNSQTAILNILEDVEEEKEKLAREKDKIQAILQSIGDGVFVVDSNLKIIVFNQVAADISGYTIEEAIGVRYEKILQFVFENDGKTNNVFIKEAISSGQIKEMSNHTVLTRKDGTKIAVADSAAPLIDKHGKVIGCVVVFRDVTKEREVDKMKTEFVSLASHQLRTPLSAIKWFLEMLLAGDAGKINSEQKDFIKQAALSNERMISLVNGLLNVSRIEAGRLSVEPRLTNLTKLSETVINELKPAFTQRKIKFEFTKLKKLPELMIDPELISQVIANLLSNAIKYTPIGGTVDFEIKTKKEEVVFSVKDNGFGIPADQQPKIFEKFFRAYNVLNKDTTGTGLGLYVAKSVVERSGGRIGFESKENKGSIFWFTLPLSGSKKMAGEKKLEKVKNLS